MAIYKFITDKDLDVGMKKYFRDQVIGTTPHVLVTSEGASFSVIQSKLNSRYDLARLFPVIKEYSSGTAYLQDDYAYVSTDNKFYKALQASTNKAPATEPTFWVEEDPRDQLLVVHAVNMTIYFFLEATNQRKITDDIYNDYATATDWLDKVKAGQENPAWPLRDDGSSVIPWGSNEKIDHYF